MDRFVWIGGDKDRLDNPLHLFWSLEAGSSRTLQCLCITAARRYIEGSLLRQSDLLFFNNNTYVGHAD